MMVRRDKTSATRATKGFRKLGGEPAVLPDLQARHASAKASFPGAARQRDVRLYLHWVWLRGGEKGAAVAKSASMVENLRDGVRGFFHTQPPKKRSSARSSPLRRSRWRRRHKTKMVGLNGGQSLVLFTRPAVMAPLRIRDEFCILWGPALASNGLHIERWTGVLILDLWVQAWISARTTVGWARMWTNVIAQEVGTAQSDTMLCGSMKG